PLTRLPDEVLLFIFSFLGVVELCQVSRTCKHWSAISTDSELWESLCYLHLPHQLQGHRHLLMKDNGFRNLLKKEAALHKEVHETVSDIKKYSEKALAELDINAISPFKLVVVGNSRVGRTSTFVS